MASKPETTFYRSVHKRLAADTYFEKMNNPYRGGTPDVWYSGEAADLWVEYKWLPRVPVRASVKVDLSEKQRLWLDNRYEEGRNVSVILGCKEGGVILTHMEWAEDVDADLFNALLQSRDEIAQWIEGVVLCGLPV